MIASRRTAIGAVALAMCAALVGACTAPADDEPSGAPSTAGSGGYDPKGFDGVSLRVLRHSGYDADVMQEAFADFTSQTGISVEMDLVPFGDLRTKEVTELSTGSATYDLMALPDYWLAQYVSAGWAAPLDDFIVDTTLTDPTFDLTDIDPRLVETNAVDGVQYALPWKFNTAVLAYRTDVFDAAPATWQEWLDGASAAQAAGMSTVGLSLSPANIPELYLDLLTASGGQFLTDDASAAAFNSPEGVAALEFLVELADDSADGAINRAWDESAGLMSQGVTASDILLSSVTGTAVSGVAAGKVAFTPIPPAATSSAFVNTWGLFVPAGSENAEAAYLLMQYLLSTDVVRTMAEGGSGAVVPARQSLLADPELNELFPAFATLSEVAGSASLWPKTEALDATWQAMSIPLQRAVLGELSVADALSQAEAAVNEELAA